jgi:prepilin-type N-terminal cleavage/methylation domain-containing protein
LFSNAGAGAAVGVGSGQRRCRRRRHLHTRPRDGGFTLLELLIVLAIIPLVVGAIAVVFVSSLQNEASISVRLAGSHDAQISSAYFVRDMQSATSISTNTSKPLCSAAGTTQLVGLSWTNGPTIVNVSYGFSTGTASPFLVRAFCTGAATPVTTIVSNGPFTGLAAPSVTNSAAVCPAGTTSCAQSPCPAQGAAKCPAGTSHVGVTVTVNCFNPNLALVCANSGIISTYPIGGANGVNSVVMKITELPTGYSYSLTGSPRNQATQTGLIPQGSEGPSMILLGSGQKVLSCGGSGHSGPVTVNGTAAVNSSSSDSLDFQGGDSISASEVYTQDPTTSGTGAPVNPPSAYSGPYANGPAFPDPFATLPDPDTTGMPVFNSAVGALGGLAQGPGVYTYTPNVTSAGVLQSGMYVLEAGLSTSGNGGLSGSSVTFFIGTPNPPTTATQSAVYSVAGNGGISLTAPVTGIYKGISVFQSRYDNQTLNISGNGANSTYGGVIYAPDAQVNSSGNGAVAAGSIVANSLVCGGNGGVAVGFAVLSAAAANATLNVGQSTTVTATVVGSPDRGAPAGSIKFYACGPTGSASSCTSAAGTLVGAAVTLNQNQPTDTSTATSASYTPNAPGWWCFGEYFTSSDGAYGASSDTTTDACVDVLGPAITVTFPTPAGSYKLSNGKWTSMSTAACSSGTAEICGTASDTAGTVTTEAINLKGPNGLCWAGTLTAGVADFTAPCATTWVTVSTTGAAAWNQTWPSTYFGANTGPYVVQVRATDNGGLQVTSAAISFSVS